MKQRDKQDAEWNARVTANLLRTSVLRIAGQRILRGLGEEEEGHHAEKAESSLAQA